VVGATLLRVITLLAIVTVAPGVPALPFLRLSGVISTPPPAATTPAFR